MGHPPFYLIFVCVQVVPEQLELGARRHEHERIEVVELCVVHRLREHVCAL